MEAVKSRARIIYGQGGGLADNPYVKGTTEHEAFKREIHRCQVEELQNMNRSLY